jgi:DNA polymerase-3 subunit beta
MRSNMRISLQVGALVEALDHIARAVDAKQARKFPVLSNTLIEAGTETILTATNLDLRASAACEAGIDEPGRVVIDAVRLQKLVAGFARDARVVIAADGGPTARVASNRSRYQFAVLDVRDFPPPFAAGDDAFEIELSSAEVAHLFATTAFASSTEATRYYLNGGYLHSLSDQMVVTCTDGYALAKASLPISRSFPGIIIPNRTVGEMLRMAKGPVRLRLDSKVIEVRAGNRVIWSKLIDASYVDYARIIPVGSSNTAELSRTALAAALGRLEAVGSGGSRAGIIWGGGGCVSLCLPECDGAAQDEVDATTTGEMQIALSIERFLRLLNEIKGDRVKLDAESPHQPILVTVPDAKENFMSMLCPMTWIRPPVAAAA